MLGFSELSVYASTANIEEVMKYYNLGDKAFKTDFNFVSIVLSVFQYDFSTCLKCSTHFLQIFDEISALKKQILARLSHLA